jgi:hypothetical protein
LILFAIDPLLGLGGNLVKPETATFGWKFKMAILLAPLALYGLLCVGQRFPATERVQAKVPARDMFLQVFRPLFLLWAFCMLLTASTELGPNSWQESVLKRTAHVSGTLIFVYTSGLMFFLRFFAGPVLHRISPIALLTGFALLAASGLYLLSVVDTPLMAFVAATIFGIGIAYFWPTMLGVTAERFPKGGALLLGLVGSFGNLAIAYVLPQMGAIYDSYTVANIPSPVREETVRLPGQSAGIPLIIPGEGTWLPEAISQQILPAGNRKLNPEVQRLLQEPEGAKVLPIVDRAQLLQAEAMGARYAFRWVAVLPCILVVIFGSIALIDRLCGGYRPVEIVSH